VPAPSLPSLARRAAYSLGATSLGAALGRAAQLEVALRRSRRRGLGEAPDIGPHCSGLHGRQASSQQLARGVHGGTPTSVLLSNHDRTPLRGRWPVTSEEGRRPPYKPSAYEMTSTSNATPPTKWLMQDPAHPRLTP